MEARGNIWGDEIYFGIPVHLSEADDAMDVVEMGDLGYWAPATPSASFRAHPHESGQRNPARQPGECVRPGGGDATIFRKVAGGTRVVLAAAE
jgi:hypothetical protein